MRAALDAALRRALGPIAAARPAATELAEDLEVLCCCAAAAEAAEAAWEATATSPAGESAPEVDTAVATAAAAAAAAEATKAATHEARRAIEARRRLTGLLDALYWEHNPARRGEAADIAAR